MMKTTLDDLLNLYDSTVQLLKEKVEDRTATAADVTNLLRLLDKAELLGALKARPPAHSAEDAPDLPFPTDDALELALYARAGGN